MRAMVIDEFGGPEKLHEADLPTPRPGPGEVLIKLVCTSVNPVEWKIREGKLHHAFPHHFPLIPGWDAAGVIAGLGQGAAGFQPGDQVYAYCRKPEIQWGCYAEFVTMAADAVAPMPSTLSFAEAATLPLTGLTAWQSLFDAARLMPGHKLLVHAGAGGVGGMAIQLAKNAGAQVATTARTVNHDYVRSLGADLAIDYTAEDLGQAIRTWAPDGLDIVFDTIGGDAQKAAYPLLRRGGTLVSIIETPRQDEADPYEVRTAYVFVSPNGGQLREMAKLAEEGKIRPPAIEEMPLEKAAEAQRLSQGHHVRGKIVLRIAEG